MGKDPGRLGTARVRTAPGLDPMIEPEKRLERYQQLQQYVGWSSQDAARLRAVAEQMAPDFPRLVADFYDQIIAKTSKEFMEGLIFQFPDFFQIGEHAL